MLLPKLKREKDKTMIKGNFLQSLFNHSVSSYGSINEIIQKSPFIANVVKPQPLVLRLRVSKRCNLSCSFCYQADSLNKKEENHLSLEEWDKVLSSLPKRTIMDVTGGETFIAKNFSSLTELILKKGFRTSLITNGSYPKVEELEKLVDNKLYFFMVSVDGLEETHNSIRGNPQSFLNICKTIELIQKIKKEKNSKRPIICLKISIAEENYHQLKETISFFHEKYNITEFTLNLLFQNKVRGGNYLHENYNHPDFISGNTQNFSPENIEKLEKSVHDCLQYGEERELQIRIKPEIELNQLSQYLRDPGAFGVKSCKKISSILTMYYDGTISPCDIGLNIGNIRDLDYDLSRAWGLKTREPLIGEIKKGYHPSCEGCCLKKHSLKSV
jgi:MoaA/NifB/PqqE/SkfB family radical SAM enzyme